MKKGEKVRCYYSRLNLVDMHYLMFVILKNIKQLIFNKLIKSLVNHLQRVSTLNKG